MSITIEFSPADLRLLQEQAAAGNVSVEEFIRQSSVKSARNAEYLAMLDKSMKEFEEGKYVRKTTEELEELIRG